MADKTAVKQAEDALRELKNLIFVLGKEYEVPASALKQISDQIEDVAKKIGSIK